MMLEGADGSGTAQKKSWWEDHRSTVQGGKGTGRPLVGGGLAPPPAGPSSQAALEHEQWPCFGGEAFRRPFKRDSRRGHQDTPLVSPPQGHHFHTVKQELQPHVAEELA